MSPDGTRAETALEESFRPRARLLQLLGDQLIGSPRLAIFELVKNAYDADATTAKVRMQHLTSDRASIQVRDNGDGMSLTTLRDIWLVPGHDHKARQRERGQRTARGRLPLGEKGVGRFAVHKLGNLVEVVTRERGGDEIVLSINWDQLSSIEYLADAPVRAFTRPPTTFKGRSHGTEVTISSLRGKPWTRGEVRRLSRQITSISSPFAAGTDDFKAGLSCPQQKSWLTDLPDTEELIDLAPWEFSFEFTDNQLSWAYDFKRIRGIKLPARSLSGESDGILLDPKDLPGADATTLKKSKTTVSTPGLQDGIGTISGRLYVYDRDPGIIERLGFSQSLKNFLDETSGVRVYRDGIRVYNYGEVGDDWLGLDIRRVNSPSKRISSNIVVGAVELRLEESTELREKTNREGFVENDAARRLRAIILGILNVFEGERNKDKAAIRRLLAKARVDAPGSIEKPLASIRRVVEGTELAAEVEPLLAQAQESYEEMRTILLRAGVSNMSLVLVFHEIEHGMRLLNQHLRRSHADESVVDQARNLVHVIDSFGDLIRKNKPEGHDLRVLARRAVDLTSVRLENHDVKLTTSLEWPDSVSPPVAEVAFGLVLGAITNLIDNSIYWLGARWPVHRSDGVRRLYIGIDGSSFDEGVAIIVADNGPGFVDQFQDASEPFFTRRPDGMGVGLYYVNLIMHALGGEARLLEPGDAGTIPEEFDGAAVALIFSRG